MKSLLKLSAAFLILSMLGCNASITPLESLVRDQAAARLIKQSLNEKALDQYIKILETSPDEPRVHLNIGVMLNQTQKPDDALKSFQLALKLAEDKKDLAAVFATRYNLGSYYGALKKVPEALANYQAALDVLPTSKETKTNIELLIQSQQQDKKSGDQGENKENQDPDQKKKEDGKNQENKDNKKDGDQKKPDDPKDGKQPEGHDNKGSPKYQPRPFKGDQLSEGDVKKILGELRNQEQKIRANFDKKERKETKNEKDW
ncbi:MAG: tetratricopeptide repeat protein [Bdellovibrio sp.]|nr:tetratricopeptide repeat protein [Bdellovibrio sp.]